MVTPVRSAGQAPIAQSAERLDGKEKVNGSIPFGGSHTDKAIRPTREIAESGVSCWAWILPAAPRLLGLMVGQPGRAGRLRMCSPGQVFSTGGGRPCGLRRR